MDKVRSASLFIHTFAFVAVTTVPRVRVVDVSLSRKFRLIVGDCSLPVAAPVNPRLVVVKVLAA